MWVNARVLVRVWASVLRADGWSRYTGRSSRLWCGIFRRAAWKPVLPCLSGRRRYYRRAGPMLNFKVLIVDDERLSRRRVRRLLSLEPDCEIVGECANGTAAVAALGASQPDIMFLDVQMPEMDGFEVARAVGDSKPLVIFTSAWDEYALRAFEVQAFDYLLKPFDGKRFRESLQRARIRVRCDRSGQPDRLSIRASESSQAARPSPDRIAVRNNGR